MSRRLRARSDWQMPQRMSANRNLNGRSWESREAAAGRKDPFDATPGVGKCSPSKARPDLPNSRRSKDTTLSQEEARGAGLSYAGECLEKARLPPGDLDLWTVAQLRMKPAIYARLDTFDELQIDDLAPIRAEELGRIEALLDGRETSG